MHFLRGRRPCTGLFSTTVDGILRASILMALFAIGLGGCQYYEQLRVLKSKADLQEEQAQLLRAYRHCLAKYEDNPPKAKEHCAVYTQQLKEIEVTRGRAQ